jgi:hypothetical protein
MYFMMVFIENLYQGGMVRTGRPWRDVFLKSGQCYTPGGPNGPLRRPRDTNPLRPATPKFPWNIFYTINLIFKTLKNSP